MDWKVALAPVIVLVVILGGTALTAQVEDDLATALDLPLDEGEFQLPDQAPPLKLQNLRLPEDLLARLPKDTKLLEELGKLELPEGTTLDLPEGFDLSDLDFNLPSDFDLKLPEGTVFDPATRSLKLPNGAHIALPDGRTFDIPPGSNMTLPAELVDRLLEQGLPAGALPRDRSFSVRDLPPGLGAKLDPPALPGNGTLKLPPGTKIQLPPGTTIPPEALAGLLPFLLPEGTQIELPDGTWTGDGVPPEYRNFPLPEPREKAPPPPDPRVAIATDIDVFPTRVPKGETFRVQGYVRERASGRDVAGAPVVVYVNETKAQPGVAVGTGASDANGRFDIEIRLPTDRPARQWQLVNHAQSFTSRAGTTYADGWGDPPIETYASTILSLDAPSRAGQNAAVRVRATLVDATGAGVPFARIDVLADGIVVRQGTTGPEGLFETTYSFASQGSHRLQARFPGTAYYDASESAERLVTVEAVAIDVGGTKRVQAGEAIDLSGRVLVDGAPAAGREVRVAPSFGLASPLVLTTDADGRFAASVTAPRTVGLHAIRYDVTEYGASAAQDVEVWTRATILLDAPERARADQPLPVSVTLRGEGGVPLSGQAIQLTLSGPGGSDAASVLTSTFGGAERGMKPPRPSDGAYTLTARLPSTRFIEAAAATRAVTLGVLDVDWQMPETIVRGRDAASSATLRFAGGPLAQENVLLTVLSEQARATGRDGTASWTVSVPARAPLGSIPVGLAIPGQQWSEQRSAHVVAVPQLRLDAPDRYDPGAPVRVNLTLVDDLGDPLPSHGLQILLKGSNWSRWLNATTDASGAWAGDVATDGAPREPLSLTVTHPAQGDHLEAETIRALAVASAPFAGADLPVWAWIAIPLVAIGGGGAAYALRRKRAVQAAPAPAPAPVAAVLRASGFDLDLGIPPGEPLAWGVGEPLSVVATTREMPEGAAIVLRGAGNELRLPVRAGVAQATLVFEREEEVGLEARRSDDDLAAPVRVGLRIVDYRKEIAREFDLLLERARAVDASLSKQTTAQEMEWILGHRLGPSAATALSDVSHVMDVANYSTQPIARADYLRFVAAVRALGPTLGGA
ncbi:MAG TPA: hypothetical protein VHH36_01675 [Candidatus Thermoplasmatota archaeon]|nr:hypothetical protein [Candidatus Thermoplasmatota archaeon]